MARFADKEQVVSKVKDKLPELSDSEVLELVDRAEEFFLSETNRISMQQRAFWLWVDLSLEINKIGTGNFQNVVTSIKRGDTNITYADGTTAGAFPTIYQRVISLKVVRVK